MENENKQMNEKEIMDAKLNDLDREYERHKLDFNKLSGKFVNWSDDEIKTVIIRNWCMVVNSNDERRYDFEADVIQIDKVPFNLGEKIIRTSSVNLIKKLRPFIEKANLEKRQFLKLRVGRSGLAKKTTYIIEEIK